MKRVSLVRMFIWGDLYSGIYGQLERALDGTRHRRSLAASVRDRIIVIPREMSDEEVGNV